MLSGDHVLPRITPNIPFHPQAGANPLGDYLASLDKLEPYDVNEVLPAHEYRFEDLRKRLEELRQHHRDRFTEVIAILSEGPHTAWTLRRTCGGLVPGMTSPASCAAPRWARRCPTSGRSRSTVSCGSTRASPHCGRSPKERPHSGRAETERDGQRVGRLTSSRRRSSEVVRDESCVRSLGGRQLGRDAGREHAGLGRSGYRAGRAHRVVNPARSTLPSMRPIRASTGARNSRPPGATSAGNKSSGSSCSGPLRGSLA